MAQKNTKNLLLASIVSVVLCLSMLIGTTFAWFTDEAASGKNKIVAGNLDIRFEYGVLNADKTAIESWADISAAENLFSSNLWEPGHTEVAYLKLTNAGSLKLKYQLSMNIEEIESVNANDEKLKLSSFIRYKLVELDAEPTPYADREAALAAKGEEKPIASFREDDKEMESGDVRYIALVVWMPSDVGNAANHKTGEVTPTIDMSVNVVATQCTGEADGFNDRYDADAWSKIEQENRKNDLIAEGYKPVESKGFDTAILNGLTGGTAENPAKVVVTENATTSNNANDYWGAPAVSLPNHSVLDLNGNTIAVDGEGKNGLAAAVGATATISGGTYIYEGTVSGSRWGAVNVREGATLTMENMTISAPDASKGYAILLSGASTPYTGGKLILRNCTINGNIFAGSKAEIILENCIVNGSFDIMVNGKMTATNSFYGDGSAIENIIR